MDGWGKMRGGHVPSAWRSAKVDGFMVSRNTRLMPFVRRWFMLALMMGGRMAEGGRGAVDGELVRWIGREGKIGG